MPVTKSKTDSIKERLLKSHDQLQLAGNPPNQLLFIPEPLIHYFTAILKQRPVSFLPEVTENDWINAIQILASHEILPLLYRKCYDLPENKRPPSVIMDQLQSAFMSANIRSMQVAKQLHHVLSAIETSGESYLVLKGPAISGSLYPHPAMRPYNDIDILVRPGSFPTVRQILYDMGYVCSALRFDRYPDLHSEESFVHANDQKTLPVELHWDIHHFYGFRGKEKVEDLFNRAVKKPFGEISFYGLDPVDEMIHQVLHLILIHTRDIRLIWLYDLFLLSEQIERGRLWPELKKRCKDWSATLAVFHMLQLAEIWTPLELPDEIKHIEKWTEQNLAEEKGWQSVLNKHENVKAMISLRLPPRLPWIKKATYIADFIFPPRENLRKRYAISHDCLLPYCYLKRLFERLIRRSWKR